MGLGHCGLGTALMPNENLSGEREREWTPGRGGDQGEQGEARGLRYLCLKVRENFSKKKIAFLRIER